MAFRTLARTTAVSLTALWALTGCTGDDGPTQGTTPPPVTVPVTTTAAPETTSPTTSPETDGPDSGEPYDPFTAEPAPTLPEAFGDWTFEDGGDGMYGTYWQDETGARIAAVVWQWIPKEEVQADKPGSQPYGEWLCGAFEDDATKLSCTANAWDGTVQLTSHDLAPEELAAAGDLLLTAWQ